MPAATVGPEPAPSRIIGASGIEVLGVSVGGLGMGGELAGGTPCPPERIFLKGLDLMVNPSYPSFNLNGAPDPMTTFIAAFSTITGKSTIHAEGCKAATQRKGRIITMIDADSPHLAAILFDKLGTIDGKRLSDRGFDRPVPCKCTGVKDTAMNRLRASQAHHAAPRAVGTSSDFARDLGIEVVNYDLNDGGN